MVGVKKGSPGVLNSIVPARFYRTYPGVFRYIPRTEMLVWLFYIAVCVYIYIYIYIPNDMAPNTPSLYATFTHTPSTLETLTHPDSPHTSRLAAHLSPQHAFHSPTLFHMSHTLHNTLHPSQRPQTQCRTRAL